MTSEKKILLHLGLPKTASTFLQKQIFPKLTTEYTRFYGKTSNGNWSDSTLWRGVRDYCLSRDESGYEAALEEVQSLAGNAIFSSEDFLNPFGFSEFGLLPERVPTFARIDRFVRLLPDDIRVRALVITREPGDWLASFHFECIKQGYFSKYDQNAFWSFLSRDCCWVNNILLNSDLAQTLKTRYPSFEVEVLSMNALVSDPLKALEPSLSFLGMNVNDRTQIDGRRTNKRNQEGSRVYLTVSDRAFLRGRLLRQVMHRGMKCSDRADRIGMLLSVHAGRIKWQGLPRYCQVPELSEPSHSSTKAQVGAPVGQGAKGYVADEG